MPEVHKLLRNAQLDSKNIYSAMLTRAVCFFHELHDGICVCDFKQQQVTQLCHASTDCIWTQLCRIETKAVVGI